MEYESEVYKFFKNRHYTTITKRIQDGHLLPIILRSHNSVDLALARHVDKYGAEEAGIYVCAIVFAYQHGAIKSCVEGCRLYKDVAESLSPEFESLAREIRVGVASVSSMMAFARVRSSQFSVVWEDRIKLYMRKMPLDLSLRDKFNLATSIIYTASDMTCGGTCESLGVNSALLSMFNIVNANRVLEGKSSISFRK